MANELPREAGPSGRATPPEPEGQQWAIQRRIEDVFTKLGEKFGDLSGRVVVTIKPETPFEHIGGIPQAKAAIRGFTTALTEPDLYLKWGINPPRGILLYGPRGTGKTMLARALATSAGAIFYHLKMMNLTSKFGPNTGELLQEIINIAKTEGKAVVYLDEANALSLEHLLPPAAARESSARLVAALCERLDGLDESSRILVVASTNRTDSVDRALVEPGRVRQRAEAKAGRPLFDEIDYRSLLPPMGGMSGAEISEVFRRALEQKVQAAGEGRDAGLVTTPDLLQQLDGYRRIREIVEKTRYGQYL